MLGNSSVFLTLKNFRHFETQKCCQLASKMPDIHAEMFLKECLKRSNFQAHFFICEQSFLAILKSKIITAGDGHKLYKTVQNFLWLENPSLEIFCVALFWSSASSQITLNTQHLQLSHPQKHIFCYRLSRLKPHLFRESIQKYFLSLNPSKVAEV